MVMEDLAAPDAYEEGGGVCLGAPASALTSEDTEIVHDAAMSYDDLKRVVVELGRIQVRRIPLFCS
jgi:hypothetical protein